MRTAILVTLALVCLLSVSALSMYLTELGPGDYARVQCVAGNIQVTRQSEWAVVIVCPTYTPTLEVNDAK